MLLFLQTRTKTSGGCFYSNYRQGQVEVVFQTKDKVKWRLFLQTNAKTDQMEVVFLKQRQDQVKFNFQLKQVERQAEFCQTKAT